MNISTEERKAAAAKAAATRKERHEAQKARFRAELNDRDRALEICRRIRDDETASDADRLEAIRMIAKITNK